MKMRKTKIIGIVAVILVVIASFLFTKSFNKEETSFEDKNVIKQKDFLSFFLENDNGEYEAASSEKWPTDGYLFNTSLSKCENGSELAWNDTKKVVTMTGNMSDKCYIYFDKYFYGVINSFTYTATTSSLTITASATKGTNEISKYYFSIDNGSTYEESTTNTYTFSDLTEGTIYTIKIKVKDSLNKEGEVYSNTAKTNTITLADVCSSGTNLETCIKTFANQGSSVSKIYHHDGTLENGIDDDSYRYAGADYVLTSKATDAGLTALYVNDSTATNGVINFYCNGSKSYFGAWCSSDYTRYYTLQYDTKNTQYAKYNEALEKAIADGYISKDNVKNYVCFGSDAATCPADNLYRIIGISGSVWDSESTKKGSLKKGVYTNNYVKLIKADYATSTLLGTDGNYYSATHYSNYQSYIGALDTVDVYYWDTGSGIWGETSLNTVNLNTNFLNNIGSTWASKIETVRWKASQLSSYSQFNQPSSVLSNYEIGKGLSSSFVSYYDGKIGLMYLSDYGFAADPSAWTTELISYYSYRSVNWMYMGFDEWTISPNTSALAFYISYFGGIDSIDVTELRAVRPTFYLTSDVTYSSGTGTASDPIRLGV